jgi:TPR repeat protein
MLAVQRGPIQWDDTQLGKIDQQGKSLQGQSLKFTYGFSNPFLSIMLAPDGQVNAILLPDDPTDWVLFDPLNPSTLPPLDQYGVDYSNYVKAVSRQKIRPEEGNFGIPLNGEEAIWFYRPSAEAGEGYAQMRLGEIYLRGEGVETNADAARLWLSIALTNGCPQATNLLLEIERSRAEPK